MASTAQEQGVLHERLRDQISESIKESLSKATAVLSSLHRVHSYLDVLKSVPSLHMDGGGEGVKGALDQVRAIRTDTAALLQTIYLTEIGLQSLEQVDKSTASFSSRSTSAREVTVPIIGNIIDPPSDLSADVITDGAINSSSRDDVMQGTAMVELENHPDISEAMLQISEDVGPPVKKQ